MESRIIQVATANPSFSRTQQEILTDVLAEIRPPASSAQFYTQFFMDEGIRQRYLAIENIGEVFRESHDEAIGRFQREAVDLAVQALERSLQGCGVSPEDLDGLIVTTCTGYLCPGLSSYIIGRLGLRPDIYAVDLVGLGCGAALPALRTADQFLRSQGPSRVAVVCVEVCTAAFCPGEDVDLILSNAIFADGAAACILTNEPRAGFALKDYRSLIQPQYREELRFTNRSSRLCNVISRRVPALAARAVESLLKQLSVNGAPHYLGFHPGGRAILDYIERTLQLNADQMRYSREVLRNFGNMSSPSILYVLHALQQNQKLSDGDEVMLFSFGAGFSAYGMTLKWSE